MVSEPTWRTPFVRHLESDRHRFGNPQRVTPSGIWYYCGLYASRLLLAILISVPGRRFLGGRIEKASDQIDSVAQFIAFGFAAREVPRQCVAAFLDRRDEAVGNAAVAHVRHQRVNGALPFRLVHAGGNALVGDDAGIALGERDEDQNPSALFSVGDAADGELLQRGTMRDGTACRPRDERDAQARQTEQRGGGKK